MEAVGGTLLVVGVVGALLLRLNADRIRERVQSALRGESLPKRVPGPDGAFHAGEQSDRSRALWRTWDRRWRRHRPLTWEFGQFGDREALLLTDVHGATTAELQRVRARVMAVLEGLGAGQASVAIADWADGELGAGAARQAARTVWPWRVIEPQPTDPIQENVYMWALGPERATLLADSMLEARRSSACLYALLIPSDDDWLLGISDVIGLVLPEDPARAAAARTALLGDAAVGDAAPGSV